MAAFIIFLAFSLLLQGALGDLVCEEIPAKMCSYSVSSTGNRCLLETRDTERGGKGKLLQCRTSAILSEEIREHIETDECIQACGADRDAIGISSDSFLEPQFTAKLCSKRCLENCPNLIDLYSNLAQAEGLLLSDLCKDQTSPRRAISEIKSSGTASAPYSGLPSGQISATAYSRTTLTSSIAPAPAYVAADTTSGSELLCEDIPVNICSYSVSSTGRRCLLEASDETGELLQCKTSHVFSDVIREHIETDDCVQSCGADRYSIGFSSDSFQQPHFTSMLCSESCLQNCLNMVDLYSNLALAQGFVLSNLCEGEDNNPRRDMSQIKS